MSLVRPLALLAGTALASLLLAGSVADAGTAAHAPAHLSRAEIHAVHAAFAQVPHTVAPALHRYGADGQRLGLHCGPDLS